MVSIEKHIENMNKTRVIDRFFIFPLSGSAWVVFKNKKEEYVPAYIWNRKTRERGDLLETWQEIQSYSKTEYEPWPVIPIPSTCPLCSSLLSEQKDFFNDQYGYKHCSHCFHKFDGVRHHIDPLSFQSSR